MAYIGKSPDGTGVRSRFYYTQTSGGGTSVSGSSDDGTSLAFSDGAYVDVFLNGVLLVAGTDYNTNTANTIAGLAALANGDVVEVVVYDIFTVADTVSALNGGTFSGAVGFSGGITGDLAATGHASVGVDAVDATRALTVAGSTDDSTASGLVVYNSSLASKFSVRNDGLITTAGNIQVGGDIRIGGTGSANALDDYEEGTWTPNVGGNATYHTQVGRYVKIGRLVYISFRMQINAIGTGTTNYMQGLPFSATEESAISTENLNDMATDVTFINFRVSDTYIYAFYQNATGVWNTLIANPHYLRNNTTIEGAGTYETSS